MAGQLRVDALLPSAYSCLPYRARWFPTVPTGGEAGRYDYENNYALAVGKAKSAVECAVTRDFILVTMVGTIRLVQRWR